MKTRSTSTRVNLLPWVASCALWTVAFPVHAQNQRYYQPQAPSYPQYNQPPPNYYQQPPAGYGANGYQQPTHYENPIEFLPKFGKRMSEMVRRLFYGRDSQPQSYGQGGGYSLDSNPHQSYAPGYLRQPPPGYSQHPQRSYSVPPPQSYSPAPQQPRYNYPPTQSQQQAPSTVKNSPPSSSPNKSSTSRRTYTPPKVTSSSSKRSHTSSSKSHTSKSTSNPPAPKDEPAPESLPPTTTARRSESSPPRESSTASTAGSSNFMKGRKTGKSGRVISPYPPYKELDVTGLDSGSLALDPTTQKIFEVP